MASPAGTLSPADASGRALQEGYVVCIPGARGNGSKVGNVYTGTAPNGLLDLKAATRWIHYNNDYLPANADRIFTDGTSAGGAMSALQGATGDASDFETYLRDMGAAKSSDKIFGAICYCPITDLNHADMEYEWLYGRTDRGIRHLTEAQIAASDSLAALAPGYINSLGLKYAKGNPITADNYMDYLKTFIMSSAQTALENGAEIPDTIGIIRYAKPPMTFAQRLGAAPSNGMMPRPQDVPMRNRKEYTEVVIDVDWNKYLNYVASQQTLKTPPAFDKLGVIGQAASPENQVFSNTEGTPANFTDFSLSYVTGNPLAQLSPRMQKRVYLMNPMNFIGNNPQGTALHWYIRHGAKDRDTSFLVPVNLATKLMNTGYDVDFALPWNRPHTGDYNLDDLFQWITDTMNK